MFEKASDSSSDYAGVLYAQVIVSFAIAICLFVATVILLLYRTNQRTRKLWKVGNEVRFDGSYFLSKPEKSIGRKIVERGINAQQNFSFTYPNAVLPSVVANGCDARVNCLSMLEETRNIFYKQYGASARLMTMRCCLSCLDGVLPQKQTEDFLRIYESILFGQHRADGVDGDVTYEEIKFVHVFFHNSILKEIQW
ncbi:hypothetical protein TRVL_09014 [Trypanosoma vivax]|uniref:Uncharacterized protein n=1 Tax=Trypanosoma vivax (strain Y486) TaxID=1055687 RepID=G0U6E7_TRYVY|nr:hypothetical protein TRVL_09014 [Trypanosoma vivax]CCC51451.1 conserved hypothetical protein [Trypanosoma vivax Y486]